MIKLQSIFLLLFTLLFFNSKAQRPAQNELFITDFNWKLKIPAFLVSENKEEWEKLKDQGRKGIENTYGVKVKKRGKNIFVFKSQDESFFEATSEPYNKNEREYLLTCQRMDDIVYHTLKTQVPNGRIDTAKSVVTIDHIKFQALTGKIVYPSGFTRNAVIFRSLFKDMELTVSVMFSNQQTGNQIIEAFKKSKFHFRKH